MCVFCRHLDEQAEGLVCSAYPAGIPEPILQSEIDHRQPYRGDHGITFAPDDKTPPPDGYLATLFPSAT